MNIYRRIFVSSSWQKSILGKIVVLGAGVGFVYWAGWPQETIPEHSFSTPQEHARPGVVSQPATLVIPPLPVQGGNLPVSPVVQPVQTVAFKTKIQNNTNSVIDLNEATIAQLESLPGVGRVLAERIVNHRSSQGIFRRIEELERVPGIGEKRLRQLRPLVGIRGTTGQ